jgi:hypothetical protein
MFIDEFLLNSHVHDSIYRKQICSGHKGLPILFKDMDQNYTVWKLQGLKFC